MIGALLILLVLFLLVRGLAGDYAGLVARVSQ